METSVLIGFIYPPPPSLWVSAMSVIGAVSMANAGIMEIRGKHMQYSKFWRTGRAISNNDEQMMVESKTGMLLGYTPAFLASAASLAFGFHAHEIISFNKIMLLNLVLTIHFFKRIFEVLFVHKYSGGMFLDAAICISLSYLISTATMIYSQHLTQGLQQPPLDLTRVGISLFVIGEIGNLYHHFLLSNLRKKGDKEYKIPKGGLFNLVVCPHYLFEIMSFVGVSCISQTLYALSFTLGSSIYLMGRSYATRRWYLSKFENFPRNVKALIPFVL
ncbi:3-oxo-5-alpha-steroid 4-dehydrogenase (NADP(+)) [Bertholletia excelsa]